MAASSEQIKTALLNGVLTVKGEFTWGSNYTFLGVVNYQEEDYPAVYKPTRGERPLWDFPPDTLALREAAAYLVSEALGWDLVPVTVYKKDGPFGPGSVQQFVEHDPDRHYFTFASADLQRLRPVALFDVLINNADRKGGHILVAPDDHLWLIDHGICFHVEDKLRTVIWDFVGEPIPPHLCHDLERFYRQLDPLIGDPSDLRDNLLSYLNKEEITALASRARTLVAGGRFPPPSSTHRPYPWPQI